MVEPGTERPHSRQHSYPGYPGASHAGARCRGPPVAHRPLHHAV